MPTVEQYYTESASHEEFNIFRSYITALKKVNPSRAETFLQKPDIKAANNEIDYWNALKGTNTQRAENFLMKAPEDAQKEVNYWMNTGQIMPEAAATQPSGAKPIRSVEEILSDTQRVIKEIEANQKAHEAEMRKLDQKFNASVERARRALGEIGAEEPAPAPGLEHSKKGKGRGR